MSNLLSLVDRTTSRFGSLTFLIDAVLERMLPQTTALAFCTQGNACGFGCRAISGSVCQKFDHAPDEVILLEIPNCSPPCCGVCYRPDGNCCY